MRLRSALEYLSESMTAASKSRSATTHHPHNDVGDHATALRQSIVVSNQYTQESPRVFMPATFKSRLIRGYFSARSDGIGACSRHEMDI